LGSPFVQLSKRNRFERQQLKKIFKEFPAGKIVPIHESLRILARTDPFDTSNVEIDLLTNQERDRLSTKVVLQNLASFSSKNASSLFLDFGAHVGWYTLLASKVLPGEKIVAVDADSRNVVLLRANLELNGITGVKTINAAMSGEVGVVEFAQHKTKSNLSSLRPSLHQTGNFDKVRVDATTVDSLIDKFTSSPDQGIFIRMDIEGGEESFAQSAEKLIYSSRPCMFFIELHQGIKKEELYNVLDQNNFELAWLSLDKGMSSVTSSDLKTPFLETDETLHVLFERVAN
jgi:FkbM family methyltransferase